MNERIRELAEQATTIEEHGWGASYENFDKNKFAELIVRECIETMYNTEQISVAQFVDATLKEHFGVE